MSEIPQLTVATPDQLRRELVDTINHDLRTPLTVVVAHTELLKDLDLPDAARHSLAAIARAGDRLLDLAQSVSRIVDLDRAAETPAA